MGTEVNTLIPGKLYEVWADDCCLSIEFKARFIKAVHDKDGDWPTTHWEGVKIKAKELIADEVAE